MIRKGYFDKIIAIFQALAQKKLRIAHKPSSNQILCNSY